MVTTQNTKIIFRLFISTTKDNIDDDNIVPFCDYCLFKLKDFCFFFIKSGKKFDKKVQELCTRHGKNRNVSV